MLLSVTLLMLGLGAAPATPLPSHPRQDSSQAATRPATRPAAQQRFPLHRLNPPVEPGAQEVPAEAALVHAPTGLTLPPELGGMKRRGVNSYNAEATDLSAGYRDDETGMTVTVYLYPAPGEDVKQIFEVETQQIERVWKTFERSAIDIEIDNIGPPLVGSLYAIGLTSEEPAIGVDGPATTYLALSEVISAQQGKRYLLKLRASVATAHAEAAQAKLAELGTDWFLLHGGAAGRAEEAQQEDPATTRAAAEAERVDVTVRGEQDIPVAAAARHVPTGLIFPPALGTAGRSDVYAYDEAALDVSAGYADLDRGIVLTLYVYPLPEGSTAKQVADGAAADVTGNTPAMRRVGGGTREDDLLSPPANGRMHWAMFATSEPTENFAVPVMSLLTLAELAEKGSDGRQYLLKIRGTYPVAGEAETNEAMWRILAEWRAANGFGRPDEGALGGAPEPATRGAGSGD